MRVLITGAPGWLGNRFLEVLVKGWENQAPLNDWKLRCLILPGIETSGLANLSKLKKIELYEGDVRRKETLSQAFRDVDVVFHIAGIIHPQRVSEMFAINTLGTENVLAESRLASVKRFVYVSSNSVAGPNLQRNQLMKENDPPRPYLNYGRSKLLAEQAVHRFQQSGKIETVILRPCWYYGPNQPLRQTTFFKMIKPGNPIIFGDGNNLRSMSYVDNTIQALILAAEKSSVNGQTYWIADAHPYSTNEIYQTVAELLDVQAYHPRHVPDFVSSVCLTADRILQSAGLYIKEIHVAGEMNKDIACSIEKAQKELGYHPAIELKEGMRRSIRWCRENGIAI